MFDMKKNLLLLFIVVYAALSATAQYVSIPDPYFRSYLMYKYPSCFDSNNMMDTTCSNIQNEKIIDISNYSRIKQLDGIQYFKSLKELNCSYNQIQNLPLLPVSLTKLNCRKNNLASLPPLPENLETLDCSDNQLTELPKLNKSIASLTCFNNNIQCLPTLPPNSLIVFLDTSYIHCKPNTTDAIFYNQTSYFGDQKYVSLQVCNSSNNVNNCYIPSSVSGRVFYDNNSNNVFDQKDVYKPNFQINLNHTSSINSDSSSSTQAGLYLLMPKVAENFTITTEAPPDFYKVMPFTTNVDFTIPSTTLVQNIALQSNLDNPDSLFITGNGDFTTGGFISILAPYIGGGWGENGIIILDYENRGTTTISPTITLQYDSSLIRYSFSSNDAVINDGKTLVLNELNLAPGEHKTLTLNFSKDFSNGNPSFLGGEMGNFSTIASIVYNGKGSVFAFNNRVTGVLPLELTTFNGLLSNDNRAVLSWITNNEIDTKVFNIEQSIDGVNFNYIASVSAKNQSTNSYNFRTNTLSNALTYFRLKMIDINGKFTYSSIVKIKSNAIINSDISVFPNPAKKRINLSVRNIVQNEQATLFNCQGAIVKKIILQQGLQTIDISNLSNGLYYFKTHNGFTKKIMIVN